MSVRARRPRVSKSEARGATSARKARCNHAKGVMAWVPWLALRLGGPFCHGTRSLVRSVILGVIMRITLVSPAVSRPRTRCLRGVERRGPARASRKCAAASAAPSRGVMWATPLRLTPESLIVGAFNATCYCNIRHLHDVTDFLMPGCGSRRAKGSGQQIDGETLKVAGLTWPEERRARRRVPPCVRVLRRA